MQCLGAHKRKWFFHVVEHFNSAISWNTIEWARGGKTPTAIHMKTPITTSKTLDKITDHMNIIGVTANILFWSGAQLSLLESNEDKFKLVLFLSGYGTGKSLLLREKAERLAMLGQKTIYVMANSRFGKKSLLQMALEEKWNAGIYHNNIAIMTKDDLQVIYKLQISYELLDNIPIWGHKK